MKKWRCTVCGYVHEGPEPPDTCPVCGADKSLFEEIEAETPEPRPAAAPSPKAEPEESAGPNARWRCTVCGYIHTGPEPPDKCPVCGADKSLFERVEPPAAGDAEPGAGEAVPSAPPIPDPRRVDLGPAPDDFRGRMRHLLIRQMLKHHAHPVSVHIPNGVLPLSFLFILIAMATGCRWLAIAAQVNLIFVALTTPVVLFSGYVEWTKRYRGARTNRFILKIVSAAVVTAISFFVSVWWLIRPEVLWSSEKWAFLFANLIMIAAAAVAGLIGGKLVFRD